ncbi:MAG: hypothetical protein EZS28_028804, partial [Streblomastix strix]
GVRAISDIVSTVDLTDYYNKTKTDELLGDKANSADLDNYYEKHDVDEMINDANELIRAVEDQIPTPATISNFIQKTGEELDQTIQGRLRQQLDERVSFDSMSDNLYITKFDALEGLVTSETFNDQLLEKADKTDLDSYVTLGTAQSINANKIFNNAYRFTSTIDGMSTITGASFVKSGADDSVVLLGAGGTKPISDGGGGDMSNYVKKIGADVQVINGILRKGEDGEESEDDDDYITRDEYNNKTNNIVNSYCVRKAGENTQNVRGRLLYVNPFGIEDDDSQLLTDTTYPTWREVSNALISKFSNFYQVLTPPVMFAGYTATQSSLIKINNQMYFFYLVVKPDSTQQAYQGRDICTVNPPPLYTLFRHLNSDYVAMFTDDGYVHFTTQATVWTQNVNVVINTFWVR